MSTYTMQLGFLVSVPVGHQVQIDFFEENLGIFGEDFSLDRKKPVFTDLETKMTFGHYQAWHSQHGFAPHEDRRFLKSYYGRVISVTIASRFGERSRMMTELVIDPMEPPGARGPYRSG